MINKYIWKQDYFAYHRNLRQGFSENHVFSKISGWLFFSNWYSPTSTCKGQQWNTLFSENPCLKLLQPNLHWISGVCMPGKPSWNKLLGFIATKTAVAYIYLIVLQELEYLEWLSSFFRRYKDCYLADRIIMHQTNQGVLKDEQK